MGLNPGYLLKNLFYFTCLFYIDLFYNFRSRTVETTTYACENNGETETRVEQKVTIQSDGEPIDHDEVVFIKKLYTKIIIKKYRLDG